MSLLGEVCMAWLSLFHRHGFGVPADDALLRVAEIREDGGAGRSEAERRILHDGLAGANGFCEVAMMLDVDVVALRGFVFVRAFGFDGAGTSGLDRVLREIVLFELLLYVFGECVNGVAGCLLDGAALRL